MNISDEPLFTRKEHCQRKRMSESTWYRLQRQGVIPPGESVGVRGTRWKNSTIDIALAKLSPRLDKPTATVEHAARWLATEKTIPVPAVQTVQTGFRLNQAEAFQAVAMAFDLRYGEQGA